VEVIGFFKLGSGNPAGASSPQAHAAMSRAIAPALETVPGSPESD
jgi:hypothetical protein